MDDVVGGTNSLPPFLSKTYEMVDDPSTDAIVSWSQAGKSFVVWNPPEFSRVLLPRYFKHSNFSSFIRQLNTYGFRKSDPEKWEFSNEDFIRGQPQLLRNIHRRKPVHSHSLQNQVNSNPLTESEKQGLKDEIERLRSEQESLHSELEKQEQERQEFEMHMQNLKERFQRMDQRQKKMLSKLAGILQKPGLALNLLFESDVNDKKRRLPRIGYFHDERNGEDDQAGNLQMLSENVDASSSLASVLELYDQMESSLTIWEHIVQDVRQAVDLRASSLDIDETTSCVESPALSCIQLNIDARPKSPTIDMNCEPSAAVTPEPPPSKEEPVAKAPNMPTGVNDVFWEQFLTENPGASETQEVQSERKDTEGRRNDTGATDSNRMWWNVRNVNSLAEQMGHLTPAERT